MFTRFTGMLWFSFTHPITGFSLPGKAGEGNGVAAFLQRGGVNFPVGTLQVWCGECVCVCVCVYVCVW